jgi:hypothetical protein
MRLAITAVAFLATGALAAPNAEPWCTRVGQSCWKNKRAAEPVAIPEPTAAPEAAAAPVADPWCTRVGQSCWKNKRAAGPVAMPEPTAAPVAVAAAEPEPWCTRVGQSCWKNKREPEAVPNPAPEAEAVPWCMRVGQSCWKAKRAAEAFAGAVSSSGGLQARTPEADISHSQGGAAYYAKRSLNELANLVALVEDDPVSFYEALALENEFPPDTETTGDDSNEPEKRSAEAAAEDKRWCMRVGQSCWKAKRAAEAVLDAIGTRSTEDFSTKPFDPKFAVKRDAEPWCMRVGQSCWKRDADPEPWCMRVGQSCWKAKRDLQAMSVVARSIVEAYE